MALGLNKTSEIDLASSQSSSPHTWAPHFLRFPTTTTFLAPPHHTAVPLGAASAGVHTQEPQL